jgi:hypothetical protein
MYWASPFCSHHFGDWVSLFAQAGVDYDAPIYPYCCSWDDRLAPPWSAFSVEIGGGCFSRTFLPRLALNCNPPNVGLLHNWDDRCAHLLLEMVSHELFAQAGIKLFLPISPSQVAKITGVSYQCQANVSYLSDLMRFSGHVQILIWLHFTNWDVENTRNC